MGNELVIRGDTVRFVSKNSHEISVRIDSDTVWLTTAQMAALFGRDESVIRRYVRDVLANGELPEGNYRQILPVIGPGRPEPSFNLDVIISIGYRVKSRQGVEFRQWATRVLKERLIEEHRHRQAKESKGILEMEGALRLAQDVLVHKEAGRDEARAIFSVIERYAKSWRLLLQYDENKFPTESGLPSKKMARLTIIQARSAVHDLKKTLFKKGEASELFGNERGEGFSAVIGNIEQTFGGDRFIQTRKSELHTSFTF